MRHTDEEIQRAATQFDELAATLEDGQYETEDTGDLRAIAVAADDIRSDETRLRDAVETARAAGRSWNRIALALGVSRQAARQRFSKPTIVKR